MFVKPIAKSREDYTCFTCGKPIPKGSPHTRIGLIPNETRYHNECCPETDPKAKKPKEKPKAKAKPKAKKTPVKV